MRQLRDATYDAVIVGGGLAGSSLAARLAKHGKRVLVLERTRQFRDRVRGEGMHSWGVPELRALGLYDRLMETCAHEAGSRTVRPPWPARAI